MIPIEDTHNIPTNVMRLKLLCEHYLNYNSPFDIRGAGGGTCVELDEAFAYLRGFAELFPDWKTFARVEWGYGEEEDRIKAVFQDIRTLLVEYERLGR